MGILDKIAAARGGVTKGWSEPPFWAFDDLRHPFLSAYPLSPDREQIETDFEGYVKGALKANGVVFALIAARQQVFAEARFQWREFTRGRPGDLFGTAELSLLEHPWPGGTTGELLALMEVDASLAGNFWATTADDNGNLGRAATGPGRRVARMRPDWVTSVIGSKSGDPYALDAKTVGIIYDPKPSVGRPETYRGPVLLLPEETCHFSPIPDPLARFRGMSWLTPLLREIQADKAATVHKERFFSNGATPNMVITFDKDTDPDAFKAFKDRFEGTHQGAWNAYKTLLLSGGADVTVIGKDFKQLDFSATQGKGESRIAAAAGVPPSWVGFSEGLQGSSLNAGNFTAARRRFADGTMRPLWRIAAASLQNLVTPPTDRAQLWYDDRDIAFLREDAKDLAEIHQVQATALRSLLDAGMDADASVRFLATGDMNVLIGAHSGLFSVQLQPPGSVETVAVTDQRKAAELIAAGWKAISISKVPLKELTA